MCVRTLVTMRHVSPSVCENISDRETRESDVCVRTLVTVRRASPSVCENISDRETRESECV